MLAFIGSAIGAIFGAFYVAWILLVLGAIYIAACILNGKKIGRRN